MCCWCSLLLLHDAACVVVVWRYGCCCCGCSGGGGAAAAYCCSQALADFQLLSGHFPFCSSISAAVGHESSYTWEGVNTAACDEILWGLLTINRAMAIQEGDDLEPVNVSLKVCATAKICRLLSTVLLRFLLRRMKGRGSV